MQYEDAVDYLYERLPMFTRDGSSAFKKDLTNIIRLCEQLGNPHLKLRFIHIAGTNGKGSTSHMLASILQTAGYRTGLYTSPHLLDFRERIRVNGAMISKESVVDFVRSNQQLIGVIQPSFFEVTVAMAFVYFAEQQTDIVVLETGLGGRLDSTNIVLPLLSLITNIGYDHTNMLGNTLEEIAGEKAGIIKPGIPVIIGEWQEEVASTFVRIAGEHGSPLIFASQQWKIQPVRKNSMELMLEVTRLDPMEVSNYSLDLTGSYQAKNLPGVLCAVDLLRTQGLHISDSDVHLALGQVQRLTGLLGRWQTLSTDPLIICDTGHNADGLREVLANIAATSFRQLHLVMGVMRDKDLDSMLPLLPKDALYYFCQVSLPRALPAVELLHIAAHHGLVGEAFDCVADALSVARQRAFPSDLIFIGGSTFIVADALSIGEDKGS